MREVVLDASAAVRVLAPADDAGFALQLSYCGALHVALAARLRALLLTADKRLANAPGLACEVEVIS